MRTAFTLIAALALTAVTGLARAQDCTTAGAPTCDGACLDGFICAEDLGGLGCACVEGAPLNVTKLQIRLNFAKPDKDVVALTATVPIPADFVVDGKSVVVDVGGVVKSFTLDAKGKSETPDGAKASLKVKAKGGVVAAQDSKLSVKMPKGNFASSFTNEGLTDTTVKDAPVTIAVDVTVDSARKRKAQPQLYSAKQGKSGRTK
jgi:hypothetical protein